MTMNAVRSALQCLAWGLMVVFWGFSATAQTNQTAPEPAPVDFELWLEEFRSEARQDGISEETLSAALTNLARDPRVIELDRHQPEFTQTFSAYMKARITPARIARGHGKIANFKHELATVSSHYGVPDHIIAAIWGMETNYGSYIGGYSVIRSLATLGHDPRRSNFFRNQLMDALHIIDDGHIASGDMLGSWAGAMGQSQFMPSSFMVFAQDFDNDGRRDIWTTSIDVFASIANYLKRNGWRTGELWGREVQLPDNFQDFAPDIVLPEPPKACRRALKDHSIQLPLARWQALGLRRVNGNDLPAAMMNASLVRPAGDGGPAFLTYANFRSILAYNCSNYYGLAVGALANMLAQGE